MASRRVQSSRSSRSRAASGARTDRAGVGGHRGAAPSVARIAEGLGVLVHRQRRGAGQGAAGPDLRPVRYTGITTSRKNVDGTLWTPVEWSEIAAVLGSGLAWEMQTVAVAP